MKLLTEVILSAMFHMSDGTILHGEEVHGWSPRVQPSMELCLSRKKFAETIPPPEGVERITFRCEERLVGSAGYIY